MEFVRALGVISERPADGHDAVARALGLERAPTGDEWTDVFVLELVPYASVYLGADGMIGGEARDRIAGFWRALGFDPPVEPDHLAALLGLAASLSEAEDAEQETARRALLRQARKALHHEHLASWLPPYLDRVRELAPPVLVAWGALLDSVLAAEQEVLGREDTLPLHLREAPALDADAPDFVGQILAPVRSGVVLTRSDLARCAGELGLGLRLGERRYALQALLEQDAPATLRWLAREARRQAARREGFWGERAETASEALSDLGEAVTKREEVAHSR